MTWKNDRTLTLLHLTHCVILHIALYMLHFTHSTLHFPLYMFHFAHSTLHIALKALKFTCCTLHVTLHTLNFASCTLHMALYTLYIHCTLQIALYTSHFIHCTIHITHFTLPINKRSSYFKLEIRLQAKRQRRKVTSPLPELLVANKKGRAVHSKF